MNSRQQVLPGAIEPPKYRFSRIDLFIGLCLLVLVGFAVQLMLRDVVTEQRPPLAETPAYVTQAPSHVFYDPYETRSLIGEIGGCVLTLIILAGALAPAPPPSGAAASIRCRTRRRARFKGWSSGQSAGRRCAARIRLPSPQNAYRR